MRYVEVSQGSAYIPKLLGIYEQELNPQIEEIVARNPRLVIDVGAAEGYYAVGLAVRLPQAHVIAFEMEPLGRRALHEMATLNEAIFRVNIRGRCEASDLQEALEKEERAVVVCDVEGYEKQLLNPDAVPGLRNAAILVELHDFLVPNITEILKNRFSSTHQITQIWQEPRFRSDFPWSTLVTRLLPGSYLDWAVSEWRPVRMAWLWIVPKQPS